VFIRYTKVKTFWNTDSNKVIFQRNKEEKKKFKKYVLIERLCPKPKWH